MHPDTPRQGDPVWIDWPNECVRRGGKAVHLTPKAYAVLRTLAGHVGQLVTKEDLLQTVWPEAVVSEAVLTGCIGELRKALGETARDPQFIQTIHRRGYRFIGPVQGSPLGDRGTQAAAGGHAERTPPLPPALLSQAFHGVSSPVAAIVGRAAELAQLHEWLERARYGMRQVIFVTGEPGLGKTTVVHTFVEQAAAAGGVRIAHGQCLEQYGTGEAYLPILEALGRLCQEPAGQPCLAILRQQAPTWLMQLPALCTPADFAGVQRQSLGTTQERMLREMAEALEAFTMDYPLVLVLEDLHWSDTATLALLSYLARRPGPARLLLLGTYRPVDVIVQQHPVRALKQDLEVHRQCTELPLELLTTAEVAQYLSTRFAAAAPPTASLQALARTVHRRTDGNPLFMVTVVDDLVRQGVVRAVGARWEMSAEHTAAAVEVPESLRQMIAQQFDGLPPEEQQMLEAASVAGSVCSAAAIAAGLEVEVEAVEGHCAGLALRGQFLEASGLEHWPDGTVAERYTWRHAMHHEVVYERMAAGRRLRLHRRIGLREEAGYGAQAPERAAALAEHFVRGQEAQRAVPYLQQAAQTALDRCACHEAIGHLVRGLEVLRMLPDTAARSQQELRLQAMLGLAVMAIKAYAAPEVQQTYARAHVLCQQVGETPQTVAVLLGLGTFHQSRGEYQASWEMMEEALRLAQRLGDPALLVEPHASLGQWCYYRGDFPQARAHLEQGLACYAPEQHSPLNFRLGTDPGVECLAFLARSLWALGYPEQARQRVGEALTLAQRRGHLLSLVQARQQTTTVLQLCREVGAAHTQAEAAVALTTEHALPYWMACAMVMHGWARAMQGQGPEAVTQIRQNLTELRAAGTKQVIPYFLGLLAEACGQAGLCEAGLTAVEEALTIVQQTGERCHEAELYRLKGELMLQDSTQHLEGNVSSAVPTPQLPHAAAEACLHQALAIARHQQAKALELRAAISLSRLWQQQNKGAEARQMLAAIYSWFTEGFHSADLQEAKMLLEGVLAVRLGENERVISGKLHPCPS